MAPKQKQPRKTAAEKAEINKQAQIRMATTIARKKASRQAEDDAAAQRQINDDLGLEGDDQQHTGDGSATEVVLDSGVTPKDRAQVVISPEKTVKSAAGRKRKAPVSEGACSV